ncbi:hypothetical protein CCP3SC1AL1_3180005 [Gammaproteobacteria bacterium]
MFDNIPAGTAVVPFIRRDGIIRPLLFKRIFSGESFLENPYIGLLEDIGKGTVFLWGKKKVRFGLENLNYTPDPHHWPLTKQLYEMGFDDSDDLRNVLNIPNMHPEKEKELKAYYLERMGNIYWNMTHEQPHAAKKLIDSFKIKRVNHEFGHRRHKTPAKNQAGAEKKVEAAKTPETPRMTAAEKEELIKKLLGEK